MDEEPDPRLRASYISKILLSNEFDLEKMSNNDFQNRFSYPGVIEESAYALMEMLRSQYD